MLLAAPLSAQTPQAPTLDDLIARLDAYLLSYEIQLANVVAEETYRQMARQGPHFRRVTFVRELRSDYALSLAADRNIRVGYRDTFEVDGEPVRDRDERLLRLLGSGAVGQAARIAEQNARFNLGEKPRPTHRERPHACDRNAASTHPEPLPRAPRGYRDTRRPSGLDRRVSRAGASDDRPQARREGSAVTDCGAARPTDR
jgi:hypothetical protein